MRPAGCTAHDNWGDGTNRVVAGRDELLLRTGRGHWIAADQGSDRKSRFFLRFEIW
jgi:hypothetical protein